MSSVHYESIVKALTPKPLAFSALRVPDWILSNVCLADCVGWLLDHVLYLPAKLGLTSDISQQFAGKAVVSNKVDLQGQRATLMTM